MAEEQTVRNVRIQTGWPELVFPSSCNTVYPYHAMVEFGSLSMTQDELNSTAVVCWTEIVHIRIRMSCVRSMGVDDTFYIHSSIVVASWLTVAFQLARIPGLPTPQSKQ